MIGRIQRRVWKSVEYGVSNGLDMAYWGFLSTDTPYLLDGYDVIAERLSEEDIDGSWYITKDELQQAWKDFGLQDAQLEYMIKEVDQDNDGRIDYAEFAAMIRKGDAEVKSRTMKGSLNFDLAKALDRPGASSKCIRVRLSSVSSNDRGQGSNKWKDKGGAPYDSRGPDHWLEHLGKFLSHFDLFVDNQLQGKKEVPINAWLFREYEELQAKKKKWMKEFPLLKAKFQELNGNAKASF
ncbi:calcium-dependent protein kinase 11-like protein [Tanacetum coccineum]